MARIWWLAPLLLLGVGADPEHHDLLCEPRSVQPYMTIPGQAIITAFVDGHSGENCTIPLTVGLEQMAALVWAVSEANAVSLVPGINIGLEIFDTCGNSVVTQRSALAALSESDCDGHYSLGVLSSYRTALAIRPMVAALDIEFLGRSLPEQKTRSTSLTALAAAETLKALNISQTAVVAHSVAALGAFVAAANKLDICVTWQEVFKNSGEYTFDSGVAPIGGSAVLLGPWEAIHEHLEGLHGGANFTSLSWVLAPTDVPWEVVSDDAHVGLPPGTLVVATSAEVALHLDSIVNQETLEALGAGVLASETPVQELRRASGAVLEAASHLREALLEDCGQFSMCAELRPLAYYNFSEEAALAASALEPPTNARQTPLESPVRLGRIDASAALETLGEIESGKKIRAENGTLSMIIEGGCEKDCVCLNEVYRPTVWSLISWRSEVWVAVVTSVAGVGVALSLAVAIFIIVRIAKDDVLEGNPTFSFILLIGVIFTYVAVLPYCAVGPRLLCVLRELGTSMGHALLLSVMLARAIMLTTTDEQGFMSHVSGYLQAALWFFIIAVQVALTSQFLLFNSAQLLAMPVSDSDNEMVCHQSRSGFLILLSYDVLLLLLLLMVSPLVARSKRNYREGLFFCVAAWLYAVCWCVWVSAFCFLGEQWRATSIALGQVSCASVVLAAVFIPRTYMIVSSVTRARIASAIPCAAAAYTSSTNILDIQYRSNQALYDSVRNVHNMGGPPAPPLPKTSPGEGVINPNFYSDHPRATQSAASTLRAGRNYASPHRVASSPDNTYTRYDSPPSPLKVTRF